MRFLTKLPVIIRKKDFLIIAGLIIISGLFHYKLKEQPTIKERDYYSYISSSGWLGQFPPNFKLKLLNGETFSIEDVIGKKIIVLNFFATWCGPCKEELPVLNRFYQQYKEYLAMIGINDDESEIKVNEFLKENKVLFPVGIDINEKISSKFNISSVPTTIIIGVDGKIQIYEVGAIYNTEATLVPIVKSNIELLNSGKVITKEEYLKQEKIWSVRLSPDEKEQLTEQEKSIAKKIYCPRGCGKDLISCNCSLCKTLIKEIKDEIKKGKPDQEIIKEINLRYCETK